MFILRLWDVGLGWCVGRNASRWWGHEQKLGDVACGPGEWTALIGGAEFEVRDDKSQLVLKAGAADGRSI